MSNFLPVLELSSFLSPSHPHRHSHNHNLSMLYHHQVSPPVMSCTLLLLCTPPLNVPSCTTSPTSLLTRQPVINAAAILHRNLDMHCIRTTSTTSAPSSTMQSVLHSLARSSVRDPSFWLDPFTRCSKHTHTYHSTYLHM